MLNISLFCYINDFAGADIGTSLLYWWYCTPGCVWDFGYGSYWL